MVNADDAAQSIGLSMKRVGPSNDKIWRRTLKASSFGCFRLMPPRTRFGSDTLRTHSNRMLPLDQAGASLYWPSSLAATARPHSNRLSPSAENRTISNRSEPILPPYCAFSPADFYLATPKRSRHSTVQ